MQIADLRFQIFKSAILNLKSGIPGRSGHESDEDHAYRKAVIPKAATEVLDGERTDVIWISTEAVDRDQEAVLARGMNDSQFALNPVVTLQHSYYPPPVGKSLWRKQVKDGDRPGIKAKTKYPERPADYPKEESWPADNTFALVQAGLLDGKSIGFLPVKTHRTEEKEAQKLGVPVGTRIVEEWLLLEYACTFLPANQEAVVQAVSKGSLALPPALLAVRGLDATLLKPRDDQPAAEPVPFTTLAEAEAAVRRAFARVDVAKLVSDRIDVARGRV